MRAVIAWWDLDDSDQTITSLREFLRDEAVDRWSTYHGLVLKFWIADPVRNRWGAVQVWESAQAAAQPLSTRGSEVIGFPPSERLEFDIEAAAAGVHGLPWPPATSPGVPWPLPVTESPAT